MSLSRKSLASQPEDRNTGSPQSGEPVYLVVGRLQRPHGVRGEINLEVLTDFPERLKPGVQVYVGEKHHPVTLRSVRPSDQVLLLAFQDLTTPEKVGEMRNQLVYVRADTLPNLPEGSYYHHQLIGMKVIADDGKMVGELVDILQTGANDVYVVQSESGEEILIPAIESSVLDVNLEKGEIRVHLAEWE